MGPPCRASGAAVPVGLACRAVQWGCHGVPRGCHLDVTLTLAMRHSIQGGRPAGPLCCHRQLSHKTWIHTSLKLDPYFSQTAKKSRIHGATPASGSHTQHKNSDGPCVGRNSDGPRVGRNGDGPCVGRNGDGPRVNVRPRACFSIRRQQINQAAKPSRRGGDWPARSSGTCCRDHHDDQTTCDPLFSSGWQA